MPTKKKTTEPEATAPHRNDPLAVGELVARHRAGRGMSLQRLSNLSGVSKSMISQIENGQVNPTLAVVWKLAEGLQVRLQDLFEAEEEAAAESAFTYLDESNCPTLGGRMKGYRIQILSTIDMADRAELYIVEIDEGREMRSDAHARGAVETLTALQGNLEVVLSTPDERHALKPMQSARYRADVPHVIRSVGPGKGLAYLAVQFDPKSIEAQRARARG